MGLHGIIKNILLTRLWLKQQKMPCKRKLDYGQWIMRLRRGIIGNLKKNIQKVFE